MHDDKMMTDSGRHWEWCNNSIQGGGGRGGGLITSTFVYILTHLPIASPRHIVNVVLLCRHENSNAKGRQSSGAEAAAPAALPRFDAEILLLLPLRWEGIAVVGNGFDVSTCCEEVMVLIDCNP